MNYASSVLNGRITIDRVGDDQATLPEGIPSPSPSTPTSSVLFTGRSELAALLVKLRDHGVALGGDHSGWPPAAVFEHPENGTQALADGNREIAMTKKSADRRQVFKGQDFAVDEGFGHEGIERRIRRAQARGHVVNPRKGSGD